MANPTPGTVIPVGTLVSPGGPQGVGGPIGPTGATGAAGPGSGVSYYGTDTVNNQNYAITVASSFVLTPGVQVWFIPTNSNTNVPPSLNVNGTGALTLATRAGVAVQGTYEIRGGRLYGAVYDGTSWRIITPLQRWSVMSVVSGNQVIECAGYDSVSATFTWSSGIGMTLNHVGFGVPVMIDIYNVSSTAQYFSLAVTDIAGNSPSVWFGPGSVVGSAYTQINPGATTTYNLPAGNRLFGVGQFFEGSPSAAGYFFIR